MLTRLRAGTLASALCTSLISAQPLPDCLIGNADDSAKSILRLVDRNGDGVWDDGIDPGENEAFDFFKVEPFFMDNNFRTVAPAATVPGGFYVVDFGFNSPEPDWRLMLMRDFLPANGFIEYGEISPALTGSFMVQGDTETEMIAYDGIAYYVSFNAGDAEGIWRMQDYNNDGDFMDVVGGVPELTPAIVEVTNRTVRTTSVPGGGVIGSDTWQIYNTPNTSVASATFLPYEVGKITFDPTTTAGSAAFGRLIFEDEELDCLLALEDLNGDGDFIDPATNTTDVGELYLFCSIYNSTNGGANRLLPDRNPDVPGVLVSNPELTYVAVDDTAFPRVYYISTLNTTGSTACTIYRAVDNNQDGDINDAGEVRVWFQAPPTDPFMPMAQVFAIKFFGGHVYASGDRVTTEGNRDSILRLVDLNQDNVIDNATEVQVLFTLPANRELTELNLFNPGALGPVPAGVPAMYQYVDAPVCTTNAATLHKLRIGGTVLGDNVPRLGRTIRINTYDAPPSAPTALFLGQLAAVPLPLSFIGLGPCSIAIDLASPTIISPLTTNVTGEVTVSLAVTSDPGFIGTNLWFQSLSLDLVGGPPQVTTSNTVRVQFGAYSYTPPMTAP